MAPSDEKRALSDLLISTLALIDQFATSLTSESKSINAVPVQDAPNPLHVLRDSAKLLKAHTTKLSLLAINKPFTPTAVSKVLKELSGTCLPAMMSAVQICCDQEKDKWGSFMGREVQLRVRRIFKEMEALMREVLSISQGNTGSTRRDSLASTGVVWESCDSLIELEQLGIGGLAVQKAEQFRDTIKDAITELQEWADGEDPENEGQRDALLDSDDEGVDGDNDSLEDIFNAANSMPKDRPELRKLVTGAQEKLKKIVLLYTALVKRRLLPFKVVPSSTVGVKQDGVAKLDNIMAGLKMLPHLIDDLISQFYELEEQEVRTALETCVQRARDTVAIAVLTYDGKEDEFTKWCGKWNEAIG
ncbi:hypothetical protein K431DRAFT_281447 [Polychaeton citri CBS 116435]|uniref:Cyclin-D1-binding protein 1-like N-terminal domain-containing protein n=1 Tax=Polychaeton citri CBS 116435 TaxID=1314669 RepID=A0A9P4QHH4_9PEZI|nr:hypothetical protein K431DRAFT_281447 [Polychaeton citri CBS 116435]